MNLNDQRADLAAVLAPLTADHDDLTIYAHIPESVSVPCVLIEPSEPYLTTTEETPFGSWQVSYDLVIAVAVGTNERMTNELDTLIGDVITTLDGAYTVAEVDQPFAYAANTAIHLAARLTVTDQIDMKPKE